MAQLDGRVHTLLPLADLARLHPGHINKLVSAGDQEPVDWELLMILNGFLSL